MREQNKVNQFYDNLISKRADASGQEVGTFMANMNEKGMKNRDIGERDPNEKHWTGKTLDEMTERDWKILREDFEISVKGGRVPQPMRTWAEGPLSWELLEAVNRVGYVTPTAVQMQAIPIACQNRDLLGVAQTGSGKTASYTLPMLEYLRKLPQLNLETAMFGPYAIVLAPTIELATQIELEVRKFKHFIPHIRSACIVGKVKAKDQEKEVFALREGVELIIGTPGRLADALSKQHTVLNQCNYVVIDEADRMVGDSAMEQFVYDIMMAIPSSNQKSLD